MKKTLIICTALAISCFSTATLAQHTTEAAKKPSFFERFFKKKSAPQAPAAATTQPAPQAANVPAPVAQPKRNLNFFEKLFGKKHQAAKPAQQQTIDQVISNNTQPSAPAQPAKKKPNFLDKLFSKKKTPAKPAPAPKKLPFRPIPVAVEKPAQPAEHPVITGKILCKGKVVTITPQNDTYVLTVPINKKRNRTYVMRRIPTTTGAVKLQNSKGNAYWLQLGNKSMLLDTSAGGRVADNCRNADQQRLQNELNNKSGSLL